MHACIYVTAEQDKHPVIIPQTEYAARARRNKEWVDDLEVAVSLDAFKEINGPFAIKVHRGAESYYVSPQSISPQNCNVINLTYDGQHYDYLAPKPSTYKVSCSQFHY